MKVKELLKEVPFTDYEIYTSPFSRLSFHTDNIRDYTEDDYLDKEVLFHQLYDEDHYDKTILANSCVSADFGEWYDDKNATVLCILV